MKKSTFRGGHDTCILADFTRAATYHQHTPLPGLPSCIPYGEPKARTDDIESRRYVAMEQAGGKADMRCGRGVNGRPPTAACKGACVYKNACLPCFFHFAECCIFVHVCRRCQRADRAGGFHVGLIFCNFSIKRKVKDYNYLRDCHLPQSTMFTHSIALSNKEVLFPPSHWCHQVYNYPHQKNPANLTTDHVLGLAGQG